MNEPTVPSIHYRRRWYYVLWSALVLLSGAGLLLWSTPARVERPKVGVVVTREGWPEGATVEAWCGPRRDWGRGAFSPLKPDAEGRLVLEGLEAPMALRRFVDRTLLPSKSHDLLALRFSAPGQPPRYLFFDLREDWYHGVLRDGKRTVFALHPAWQDLPADPRLPPGLD